MVARGTYDGYYEINLKAWDVAAGIIILEEAGGIVTNTRNEEYNMFGSEPIVATNGFIHKELLSYLS
jgi:myo-inositol-1(or 4)-monophosphatase